MAQKKKKAKKKSKPASFEEALAEVESIVQELEEGRIGLAEALDRYLFTLEAILEFFPRYPEPMAAVVMKFQDGCDMAEMAARFGRSPTDTSSRFIWMGLAF